MPHVIRARCVWPISDGPIENGAIVLDGPRIHEVGRWIDLREEPDITVEDLGEVVIIPGLVNSHCHLDYTDMGGKIPPPSNFPDWIKTILSFKAHWSYTDFARSWLNGARMLLESGTTTVLDIESVPELLPEAWESTPLRLWSFLEMTGVQKSRDPAKLLRETLEQIKETPTIEHKKASLSPHSVYSVPPGLLALTALTSRQQQLPIQIHLAESKEEDQLFSETSGSLYDWLRSQRDMTGFVESSPVQHLDRAGLLGPNVMAIHVNYIREGDAELLARSKTTVVHCPKSHDYFNHRAFPFKTFTQAGVNICLGTDSLASSRKIGAEVLRLNLWQEMQLFQHKHGVNPKQVFEMVTVNPARALRGYTELGLKKGSWADFTILHYEGKVSENRLSENCLYNPVVRCSYVAGSRVQQGFK